MSTHVRTAPAPAARDARHRAALIAMTAIFFMWGFITELNGVLIPHLQSVFQLTHARSMLLDSAFFGAYFVMAVPAGRVVARVGYKLGIVIGLLIAGAGALLVLPAVQAASFDLFLPALFILATGVVLLQVSANPYVSLLGAPERAASRLNFAQAVNSLGHTIGPYVAGLLIFSATMLSAEQLAALPAAQRVQTVQPLYLGVAAALIALALAVYFFRLPALTEATEQSGTRKHGFLEVLRHPHLRWGVLAVFFYVGVEVTVAHFMVKYVSRPEIGAMPEADASLYLSYYHGLAMLGRFVGAALLMSANPRRLLPLYAAINIALLLTTMSSAGGVALWSVVLVGLFNSIMFPTIFTLAIERLGPMTEKASSLLVMAIVGGAVIPPLQGACVDLFQVALGDETRALQYAFFVSALCYAYIVWYGLRGSRLRRPPAGSGGERG
ncbi:sugar MFS transporter [Vulcaniibacterium tengchongense]|uniref:FHS family L-fucose permease-like MFS transporter n=1 Tax=Vulcaniibacterium tengchongense TaxID=1273429 RepID=A0A3N4VP28_9GAMM|nr:sugar MFS transporter [Vulcaniibacterium tengchongense]RPE74834.1 FHS family L-fucose permease-like MFS transporter [Vulcaniibacterium tengchongense]